MRLFAAALLGCACLFAPSTAAAQVEDFDSIRLYTLANDTGMTVRVTNYGAIITSIRHPNANGDTVDVALGYDSVEKYINAVDKPYFGAIVGRYGNRIAGATFELDGETYELLANNGPNHLHGGGVGFDKVVWEVAEYDAKKATILLSYTAKDGEEGYPGNLTVRVRYTLEDGRDTDGGIRGVGELRIDYEAETDAPTPVNVTQHTYFNLAGEGSGSILDHEAMIAASRYTPVDETLIPTGEFAPVEGTPFDFRQSKPIGRDIGADDEQLSYGGGYDHNWVLDKPQDVTNQGAGDKPHLAARVREPKSGRVLEVYTTEPGVQFYVGNFLDGRLTGKSGRPYEYRGGFCLETQHFPDSPNQPGFPSTILRPGETLRSQTVFRFGAE